MSSIQPGTYFTLYFVMWNDFVGKKRSIIRAGWDHKTDWRRRIAKSGKEADCPGVFPCSEICMQQSVTFSGFLPCYPEQPRPYQDSLEDDWITVEKKQICEPDSWFWLPPTERMKRFIVSVDTWFLVIYCLLLLFLKLFSYFILKGGCEKSPSFFLGISPHLSLQATATVLCQSFSGSACEWSLRRLAR
jgi:hypothetical protein